MKEYQVNGRTYHFEIDTTNGEAEIFDDDDKRVDVVDLYDLLAEYEDKSRRRIEQCIKQNERTYRFELLNDDREFVPKERPDEQLDELAIQLYDAERGSDGFLDNFTTGELRRLWSICQNNLGAAYDDEVYDALYEIGEFDRVTQ